MSLLMYAIGEERMSVTDARGLGGRPLRALAGEGLTMVVSEHQAQRLEVAAEDLWQYERVLEELMENGTILPARFGTVLTDPDAALDALRVRREEFRQGLARVKGAVELGISGSWREDSGNASAADGTSERPRAGGEQRAAEGPTDRPRPEGEHRGTDYMRARLDLHRRAWSAEARLRPLQDLARGSTVKVLPRPDQPIAGAYLVDRARVEEFDQLAQRLGGQLEHVAIECTGPWPPYSFASGGAG